MIEIVIIKNQETFRIFRGEGVLLLAVGGGDLLVLLSVAGHHGFLLAGKYGLEAGLEIV